MLMLQLPAVHLEGVALGLHLGPDDGIDVFNQIHDIFIGQVQGGLAGLYLADVQDIVNQAQQMLAGGGDFLGVLHHTLRIVHVPGQQGGKAHDGVHGGADVMAHVGEEGALCPVGLLGDAEGLLCGLLGLSQHGIGLLQLLVELLLAAEVFLLLAEQPCAALLLSQGGDGQHQHGQQDQSQDQQHLDDGLDHVHGAGGHEIRGNEEEQQGVVLLQGGETVVVFAAVVAEVGA